FDERGRRNGVMAFSARLRPKGRRSHSAPPGLNTTALRLDSTDDSLIRNYLEINELWVRKKGPEPSRPCGHKLLRLARLPIPPLPHMKRLGSSPSPAGTTNYRPTLIINLHHFDHQPAPLH